MKILLKSAKLFISLIIIVFILLISAAFFLENRVGLTVLDSLNKNLSTKIRTGSLHLSFIRKFPKASVELRNVVIQSSNNFNKGLFRNQDTLLTAESVFMEFRITDFIRGNYTISSMSASDGYVYLLVDSAGHTNYDIYTENNESQINSTRIELEKIDLENTVINYIDLSSHVSLTGVIREGILKTTISGSIIRFSAEAETRINELRVYNTQVFRNTDAEVSISLKSDNSGILFNESTIETGNSQLRFQGSVSSDDVYDLTVAGDHIDLRDVKNCLPEKLSGLVSDYYPEGSFTGECTIKGQLNESKNPHIIADIALSDGKLRLKDSGSEIKNIKFNAVITNGSDNSLNTSIATFNDMMFSLGTTDYTGLLIIRNFTNPSEEISIKGKVLPSELKDFFKISEIISASGSADVDLKLITDFRPGDSLSLDYLVSLKPEAKISFNSFSIGLKKNGFNVSNVNGILNISDVYKADDLNFEYKAQNIRFSGTAEHLPEWLSGKNNLLVVSGDVYFDRFIPEAFLPVNKNKGKSVILFPKDLLLDLKFRIDSSKVNTFSAGAISGRLNYKPGQLTFKSLSLKSLEGTISGDGFIVQNEGHSFITRADLDISGININKAFKTFHDFGQEFIKAENLSGDVSGSVSLLLPMDQYFNPRIKSVSAEGRFIITNGALVNFEPVSRLSSFVEMSELKNIHFQKLENDFFIRNNVFYIPQMDVKSSAADITLNGKHSFDNDYEYHVKILLSQILSKKRKSIKSNVSEYGVIEDDGLGRTSLLLKVEDKGDDVRVSYDIKAATTGIKNSLKSEKQSLKTILNEEYGWYKDDPQVSKTKTETKKPRFTVTWEENDPSSSKP
jgi:hypothetical protein